MSASPLGMLRFACAAAAALLAASAVRAQHENPTRARSRLTLTEPEVRRLFPEVLRHSVFHPSVYFHEPPNIRAMVKMPEHPQGEWELRTNSLGLRMDREISDVKPDVRVLITGDANVAGTCSNKDSIGARLERWLQAERGGTNEVINAGNGSYCFYNFAGVQDRFAELRPDVFVIVVCWNDFDESFHARSAFTSQQMPAPPPQVVARFKECVAEHQTALSQGLQGVRIFKSHPEQVDVVLNTAVALIGEIAGRCDVLGTKLLVAYAPPIYESRADDVVRDLAKLFELMELERKDLDVITRVADRFLLNMRALRIPAIDMREAFKASKDLPYWKVDHHFSLAGNEITANEIQKVLPKLLPPAKQ